MNRFLQTCMFFIYLFWLGMPLVRAQVQLDLKDCIAIALDRNLALDKSEWGLKNKEVDIQTSKNERLPTINGYSNLFTNFGQSQDVFGNAARNDNFNGTMGVSSNYSIFNYGKTKNTIKREELLLAANQQDLAFLKGEITIKVIQRYLNIMLQREISQAKDTALIFAQNQLQKVKKSTDLGSTSLTVLYEAEANYAREKEKSFQAHYAQDKAILELKQTMALPTDSAITIGDELQFPFLENFQIADKSALFKTTFAHHPQLKKYTYLNESLVFDKKVIGAQLYPSVDASVSLGSFYFNNLTSRYGNIPFFKQMQGNFSQQVGLSINVPIFNKHAVKNAIKKSNIQMQENLAQIELEKETIRQDMEKYFLDLTNFQNQYVSLTKIGEMSKKAFGVSLKSYEAGRISIYDLHNSRANLLAVESELIQAKFNVFFTKILIYYNTTGSLD